MTCFCSTSALPQPQLLRGQRAPAPNPVGFPGTWPLPGPPPPTAPSGITQPGSACLPEAARQLLFLPVRPPGLGPMSPQAPAPPVSFPAAHLPWGPGAPCSSTIQTAGIFTPQPGQSSSRGFPFPFLLSVIVCLSSPPHYHLGSLFLKPVNWGPWAGECQLRVWLVFRGRCGGLQLK